MKSLKSKAGFILMLGTTLALGAYPATHAFCQDSAAGQQMDQSGQDIKGAGSDTVDSAIHAYHGTADEMSDAALTTKVKSKLLSDSKVRPYSIHVESDQGKVVLDGSVDSPTTAKYAEADVAAVKGVQSVDNRLTWPTSQN
jgi:hyperosmotically inducible periplasmic protein